MAEAQQLPCPRLELQTLGICPWPAMFPVGPSHLYIFPQKLGSPASASYLFSGTGYLFRTQAGAGTPLANSGRLQNVPFICFWIVMWSRFALTTTKLKGMQLEGLLASLPLAAQDRFAR